MRIKNLRRRKNKRHQNSSSWRLARSRRPSLELLEDRRLLAGNNVFAQFSGDIATPGDRVEIPIAVSTQDFTFRGESTLLGFHVRAASGSLDPSVAEIRNQIGARLAPVYSASNVGGGVDSLALAEVGMGGFTVAVTGESSSVGAFEVDVFLVGDVDGNRTVDRSDADIIRSIFGAQQGDASYLLEADANLDGRITSFDLFQWRVNSSDATAIQPLDLQLNAVVAGASRGAVSISALDGDSIMLAGVTSPSAPVELDIDDNGTIEQVAIANDQGSFSFDLSFADAGVRILSVAARDSFGQQTREELILDVRESFQVESVSPSSGEEMVSVARKAVVRFTEEVDATTVTPDSIKAISLGAEVAGRLVVSTTNRFVTFYPDEPWSPSAEIRLLINGDLIRTALGDQLDADSDGQSGGLLQSDFSTLPLTRIANTNVFGFVRDSYTGEPIVGATIRVDAFSEANALTDEDGRFELVDMPAPEFFVHVDGSTATNAPVGFAYPNVGKPFHSVPGQTVQLNMNGEPFDIYLPPMAIGDVQPLSATSTTEVGFGDAGKAELVRMFPGLASEMWDVMKVSFAPGSAIDRFGNASTQAVVIPVPAERIPAPLPPTLNPSLVVSIQAMGATTFDVPAPVVFPNVDGIAPGEKTLIMSFDHDAGKWKAVGTATVSADGVSVASDPGSGILAPGWHFVQVGTNAEGEPCDTQCLVVNDKLGRRIPVVFSDDLLPIDDRGVRATAEDWTFVAGEGGLFFDSSGTPLPKGESRPIPDRLVFFLPDILTASTSPIDPGQAASQGTGSFSATLIDSLGNKTRATGPLLVRVEQGWGDFSVPASIDSTSTPLAIAHVQQRLRYLGYHGTVGNAATLIEMNGHYDPETRHAITVFNAAADGGENTNVSQVSGNMLNGLVNFQSAPRWVELTGPMAQTGSNAENWMTHWAKELLIAAAAERNFNQGSGSNFLGASRRGGGPNSHGTHQAGMDIDIETPSKNDSDSPFFATIEIDGMRYVAAADSMVLIDSDPGPTFAPMPVSTDSELFSAEVGITVDDVWEQKERLRAIRTFIVDATGYKLADVRADIMAFINATTESGASVLSVWYNDPRTWDIAGVTYKDVHGGHFHVNVKKPSVSALSADALTSLASAAVHGISEVPGFGDDNRLHYRFDLANGFAIAGRSSAGGAFSEIISPNTEYTLTIYQASTNRSAVRIGVSNASGAITDLGEIILDQFGGADSDGDGLPDTGEHAIGTSPNSIDTDGDGITDDAEIIQGLDPLDDRGFPTGTISTLPLPGQAKELVIENNTAYVATGSHGLAIVDVSRFNMPILLGQIDLAGDATDVDVDSELELAAVTTGDGGLQILDISDPMMPTIARSLNVLGNRVEVLDGFAYVPVGSSIRAIDLETGDEATRHSVGNSVTDIRTEGTLLYVMDVNNTVSVIETAGIEMKTAGFVSVPEGGGKLFVGNGIGYAAAKSSINGGYSTIDATDSGNPSLIGGPQVPGGFNVPGEGIAANGSGLVILVGGRSLSVFDATDLANTNSQLVRLDVLNNGSSVAIASGIAFVADAAAGLQVVNYLPFDSNGVPPTVTISTPVMDVDAARIGIQVLEGTTIPVRVNVTDDRQVSGVQLLADGAITASDSTFPFEFFARAPGTPGGTATISLQVNAMDTGGNSNLSNILSIDVVPDLEPPTLIGLQPEGDDVIAGLRVVRLQFSEPLSLESDPQTNIRLLDDEGNNIPANRIRFRADERIVELHFDPLVAGTYQVVVDAVNITDRAGNVMGPAPIVRQFSVRDPLPAETFIGGDPFETSGPITAFVSGDINNDGNVDIVAGVPGSGTYAIFIGRGDGTFDDAIEVSESLGFQSMALGDLNGDGNLDLVAAGVEQPVAFRRMAVYLGRGDGTFAPPTKRAVGDWEYRTLSLGDLDGDGDLDIITAGGLTLFGDDFPNTNDFTVVNMISVHQGRGNGTFVSPQPVSVDGIDGPIQAAELGDINNDGDLDVVFGIETNVPVDVALLEVLLGGPGLTFGQPTAYGSSFGNNDSYSSLDLGDLNGDGNLDLVTPTDFRGLRIYLGRGDGGFENSRFAMAPFKLDDVALGDTNLDGILDAVASGASGTSAVVLNGDGDGGFASSTEFEAGKFSFRGDVELSDVDNDTDLDVLTIYYDWPIRFGITVRLNTNVHDVLVAANGEDSVDDSVELDIVSTLAGDFNGDGTVDAADYTVFRKTLGQIVPAYFAADGNGNGIIDQGDYDVWKANFGKTLSVPGPDSSPTLLLAAAAVSESFTPSPRQPMATSTAFDIALLDVGTDLLTRPLSATRKLVNSRPTNIPTPQTVTDQLLLLAHRYDWTIGQRRHEYSDHTSGTKARLAVDELFADLGSEPMQRKLFSENW